MASKKEFVEDAPEEDDAFEYMPNYDSDVEALLVDSKKKPVTRNHLGFVRT